MSESIKQYIIKITADVSDADAKLKQLAKSAEKMDKINLNFNIEKGFQGEVSQITGALGKIQEELKQVEQKVGKTTLDDSFKDMASSLKDSVNDIKTAVDSLKDTFKGLSENLSVLSEKDLFKKPFSDLADQIKAMLDSYQTSMDLINNIMTGAVDASPQAMSAISNAIKKDVDSGKKIMAEAEKEANEIKEKAQGVSRALEEALNNFLPKRVGISQALSDMEYTRPQLEEYRDELEMIGNLTEELDSLVKKSPALRGFSSNDIYKRVGISKKTIRDYSRDIGRELTDVRDQYSGNDRYARIKSQDKNREPIVVPLDVVIQPEAYDEEHILDMVSEIQTKIQKKIQTQLALNPLKLPIGFSSVVETDDKSDDDIYESLKGKGDEKVDDIVRSLRLRLEVDTSKMVSTINSAIDAVNESDAISKIKVDIETRDINGAPITQNINKIANDIEHKIRENNAITDGAVVVDAQNQVTQNINLGNFTDIARDSTSLKILAAINGLSKNGIPFSGVVGKSGTFVTDGEIPVVVQSPDGTELGGEKEKHLYNPAKRKIVSPVLEGLIESRNEEMAALNAAVQQRQGIETLKKLISNRKSTEEDLRNSNIFNETYTYDGKEYALFGGVRQPIEEFREDLIKIFREGKKRIQEEVDKIVAQYSEESLSQIDAYRGGDPEYRRMYAELEQRKSLLEKSLAQEEIVSERLANKAGYANGLHPQSEEEDKKALGTIRENIKNQREAIGALTNEFEQYVADNVLMVAQWKNVVSNIITSDRNNATKDSVAANKYIKDNDLTAKFNSYMVQEQKNASDQARELDSLIETAQREHDKRLGNIQDLKDFRESELKHGAGTEEIDEQIRSEQLVVSNMEIELSSLRGKKTQLDDVINKSSGQFAVEFVQKVFTDLESRLKGSTEYTKEYQDIINTVKDKAIKDIIKSIVNDLKTPLSAEETKSALASGNQMRTMNIHDQEAFIKKRIEMIADNLSSMGINTDKFGEVKVDESKIAKSPEDAKREIEEKVGKIVEERERQKDLVKNALDRDFKFLQLAKQETLTEEEQTEYDERFEAIQRALNTQEYIKQNPEKMEKLELIQDKMKRGLKVTEDELKFFNEAQKMLSSDDIIKVARSKEELLEFAKKDIDNSKAALNMIHKTAQESIDSIIRGTKINNINGNKPLLIENDRQYELNKERIKRDQEILAGYADRVTAKESAQGGIDTSALTSDEAKHFWSTRNGLIQAIIANSAYELSTGKKSTQYDDVKPTGFSINGLNLDKVTSQIYADISSHNLNEMSDAELEKLKGDLVTVLTQLVENQGTTLTDEEIELKAVEMLAQKMDQMQSRIAEIDESVALLDQIITTADANIKVAESAGVSSKEYSKIKRQAEREKSDLLYERGITESAYADISSNKKKYAWITKNGKKIFKKPDEVQQELIGLSQRDAELSRQVQSMIGLSDEETGDFIELLNQYQTKKKQESDALQAYITARRKEEDIGRELKNLYSQKDGAESRFQKAQRIIENSAGQDESVIAEAEDFYRKVIGTQAEFDFAIVDMDKKGRGYNKARNETKKAYAQMTSRFGKQQDAIEKMIGEVTYTFPSELAEKYGINDEVISVIGETYEQSYAQIQEQTGIIREAESTLLRDAEKPFAQLKREHEDINTYDDANKYLNGLRAKIRDAKDKRSDSAKEIMALLPKLSSDEIFDILDNIIVEHTPSEEIADILGELDLNRTTREELLDFMEEATKRGRVNTTGVAQKIVEVYKKKIKEERDKPRIAIETTKGALKDIEKELTKRETKKSQERQLQDEKLRMKKEMEEQQKALADTIRRSKELEELKAKLNSDPEKTKDTIAEYYNQLIAQQNQRIENAKQVLQASKDALDKLLNTTGDQQKKIDEVGKPKVRSFQEILNEINPQDDTLERYLSSKEIVDNELAEIEKMKPGKEKVARKIALNSKDNSAMQEFIKARNNLANKLAEQIEHDITELTSELMRMVDSGASEEDISVIARKIWQKVEELNNTEFQKAMIQSGDKMVSRGAYSLSGTVGKETLNEYVSRLVDNPYAIIDDSVAKSEKIKENIAAAESDLQNMIQVRDQFISKRDETLSLDSEGLNKINIDRFIGLPDISAKQREQSQRLQATIDKYVERFEEEPWNKETAKKRQEKLRKQKSQIGITEKTETELDNEANAARLQSISSISKETEEIEKNTQELKKNTEERKKNTSAEKAAEKGKDKKPKEDHPLKALAQEGNERYSQAKPADRDKILEEYVTQGLSVRPYNGKKNTGYTLVYGNQVNEEVQAATDEFIRTHNITVQKAKEEMSKPTEESKPTEGKKIPEEKKPTEGEKPTEEDKPYKTTREEAKKFREAIYSALSQDAIDNIIKEAFEKGYGVNRKDGTYTIKKSADKESLKDYEQYLAERKELDKEFFMKNLASKGNSEYTAAKTLEEKSRVLKDYVDQGLRLFEQETPATYKNGKPNKKAGQKKYVLSATGDIEGTDITESFKNDTVTIKIQVETNAEDLKDNKGADAPKSNTSRIDIPNNLGGLSDEAIIDLDKRITEENQKTIRDVVSHPDDNVIQDYSHKLDDLMQQIVVEMVERGYEMVDGAWKKIIEETDTTVNTPEKAVGKTNKILGYKDRNGKIYTEEDFATQEGLAEQVIKSGRLQAGKDTDAGKFWKESIANAEAYIAKAREASAVTDEVATSEAQSSSTNGVYQYLNHDTQGIEETPEAINQIEQQAEAQERLNKAESDSQNISPKDESAIHEKNGKSIEGEAESQEKLNKAKAQPESGDTKDESLAHDKNKEAIEAETRAKQKSNNTEPNNTTEEINREADAHVENAKNIKTEADAKRESGKVSGNNDTQNIEKEADAHKENARSINEETEARKKSNKEKNTGNTSNTKEEKIDKYGINEKGYELSFTRAQKLIDELNNKDLPRIAELKALLEDVNISGTTPGDEAKIANAEQRVKSFETIRKRLRQQIKTLQEELSDSEFAGSKGNPSGQYTGRFFKDILADLEKQAKDFDTEFDKIMRNISSTRGNKYKEYYDNIIKNISSKEKTANAPGYNTFVAGINSIHQQFKQGEITLEQYQQQLKEVYDWYKKYNSINSVFGKNKIGDIIKTDVGTTQDARSVIQEYINNNYKKQLTDLRGTVTGGNGEAVSTFTTKVINAKGEVEQLKFAYSEFSNEVRMSETVLEDASSGFSRLINSVTGKVKQLALYWTADLLNPYRMIGVFKQMVGAVKELDTALTEMRKVSNESYETLKQFSHVESFDIAAQTGTTAQQIQQSTADFMRLGESFSEAKESARQATILKNVSEFTDINAATESLTAMSQAYKELSKSEIIDKLNYIGNNYSISTSELAQSLQKSAGTLKVAGDTIDEAIALTTAGNAVLQDPLIVGQSLKTMALRLNGTKAGELEEMGEDTVGLISTTSKLQQTIKDLTRVASNKYQGFDILDDNGNYKSTYEKLVGIAKVYKEIGEEDKKFGTNRQSLLLETIAGENLPDKYGNIFLRTHLNALIA